MKTILLFLAAALGVAVAQDSNFAAAGVSYNRGVTPSVAGTGLFARPLVGGSTYAFTAVDALPVSTKPIVVTTQFSAGIAQRISSPGGVAIYIPTSAGISYSGTNTGWAWTTGALAVVPVGKTWRILPNVRVVKSSINDGSGYQVIGGILFGWGW